MADVVALVDDLFFQSKMMETARHVGVTLKTCSTGDALLAEIESTPPKLIVLDLNARNNPLDAVVRVRATGNPAPLIAYLSHVQTELAEQARAAGCQDVMPRSKFTANLAAIFAGAKS